MALNPSNGSNLEQLALKGLISRYVRYTWSSLVGAEILVSSADADNTLLNDVQMMRLGTTHCIDTRPQSLSVTTTRYNVSANL